MGKVIRETKYGRKPRSPLAALKQARQFLIDEGKDHWCKGSLVNVAGGVQDPDAPLCGKWGVCAMGAVALVAGDLHVESYQHGDGGIIDAWISDGARPDRVVERAYDALNDASPNGDVAELNDRDNTRRRDVIRVFDKAIKNLGGK